MDIPKTTTMFKTIITTAEQMRLKQNKKEINRLFNLKTKKSINKFKKVKNKINPAIIFTGVEIN
jgi:hypothetical protein